MSRVLPLVCVFSSVQLFLASAEVRAGEEHPLVYPPPPAHMSFQPLEPNPYFVQDEHDPRLLHPAPGAKERGIDRGYVERMARGAKLTPALDVLDRDAPLPTSQTSQLQLPDPAALPLAATAVTGNVLVIEGNDSLTPMTQEGRMFDHRRGLETVISQVWQRLGDNFDFITVMTTFKDAGVAAYYLPLKQDVAGLGECDFNNGNTFGCIFDQVGAGLQGFVFMNSMGYWRDWDTQMKGAVQPTGSFDASVYAVMGQEVAHRWG
ncbi:MAG: hypothetical protein ACO3JL_18065, partial [Myxococcota bacterium]